MEDLKEQKDKVRALLNFIILNDTFANQNDVRSITINNFVQITQSFLFSLILSYNLKDINYCKANLSKELQEEDLDVINCNYEGFIKNAYFINIFVSIENHIRQLGLHFERNPEDINVQSITQTFRNLKNQNKTDVFSSLTNEDFKLFEFYCFIRNTMHNMGFQTKNDKCLLLEDNDSVIFTGRREICLIKDQANYLTFDDLILLTEQVIKLVLKINSLIPQSIEIKHPLSDIGYNS